MPTASNKTASSTTACSLADGLVAWFWKHRHDHFTAGRDGLDWVLPLYDIRSRLEAIEGRGHGQFPAFAIWGPSQTGKSTLLSGIIDANANDVGVGSALHWGGVPIRFAGDAKSNSFNPYTGGMDASGCVTRFHLGEPKYPNFPVRLKLARPAELRMALAAGYLDECVCEDESGEKVVWSEMSINNRFTNMFKDSRRDGSAATPATVGEVWKLCEIIRKFVIGGRDRYINLRKTLDTLERNWARETVFASPKALKQWAGVVLWDGNAVLDAFADKMENWMAEDRNHFLSDKPVYCSSVLASKLVNIAAYQNMLDGIEDFRDLHRKIRYIENERGDVLLDCESGALAPGAGQAFCRSPLDFGFLQGLVWEIIVHLNRANISDSDTGFTTFMERSDLLDFPGVAVAQKGENAIDLRSNGHDFTPEMLTKVLKRGKTSSIVYRYAETLGIDGMTLLNRALTPVSSPNQIVSGVRAWLAAAKEDYKPGEKTPLPLNIAVTRAAQLFNDYWHNMKSEVVSASLSEHIAALGWVSNPKALHHFFSLTYHLAGKFIRQREGEIRYSREPQFFDSAAPAIESEYEKAGRFETDVSRRSFEHMYKDPDGGVNFFFESLAAQAADTRGNRDALATRRAANLIEELADHCEPEVPRVNVAMLVNEREQDFEKFERQITTTLATANANAAHELFRLIKELFYVEVDNMPAFARSPHSSVEEDLLAYIEEVIAGWKKHTADNSAKIAARFRTLSSANINRVIGYCADDVPREQFVEWAHSIGLPFKDETFQLQVRRHTATWVANHLPLRKAADLRELPPALAQTTPPAAAIVQWVSIAKMLINLAHVRAKEIKLDVEAEKLGDDTLRELFDQARELAGQNTPEDVATGANSR
jgi:hypothetical protein